MRNLQGHQAAGTRSDRRGMFRTICNFSLAAGIATLPLVSWMFAQTPASKTPAKTSGKSYTPGRTPDGQPDIQGIWSNASIIPLERPKELADKPFYTPQELKAYEDKAFARSVRDKAPASGNVGTYNDFWWDGDSKRALNLRTSLIVDPPDGRVPPYTPEAQKRIDAERAYSRAHAFDGPEDRSLMERCLPFPTTGPPMLPSFYTGTLFGPLTTNYQIVQVPGYVVLVLEIVHDARVIPLDGRPHVPSNVRNWLGDSRGRWEGNTLIVDTTNFTGKSKFRGADENMHLIERFTRKDKDTLLYEFTIDNPTVFTKPWSAEIPMIASDGPLFEHACHEGNYGLQGILAGAREEERKAGK